MNNFKGCVHCVCLTGSGCKRSCEEQNIDKDEDTIEVKHDDDDKARKSN